MVIWASQTWTDGVLGLGCGVLLVLIERARGGWGWKERSGPARTLGPTCALVGGAVLVNVFLGLRVQHSLVLDFENGFRVL